MPKVVALLGGESSGKSTLALSLAEQLQALEVNVQIVPEYLREFCETHQRVPYAQDQRHIADEQNRRLQSAIASGVDIVITDSTSLLTAVYSEQYFQDSSLYPDALEWHRQEIDLTLLMSFTDVAWQADGIHRDGPRHREVTDQLLRRQLARHHLDYAVIYGEPLSRTQQVMSLIKRTWPTLMPDSDPAPERAAQGRRWRCIGECPDGAPCDTHPYFRFNELL